MRMSRTDDVPAVISIACYANIFHYLSNNNNNNNQLLTMVGVRVR